MNSNLRCLCSDWRSMEDCEDKIGGWLHNVILWWKKCIIKHAIWSTLGEYYTWSVQDDLYVGISDKQYLSLIALKWGMKQEPLQWNHDSGHWLWIKVRFSSAWLHDNTWVINLKGNKVSAEGNTCTDEPHYHSRLKNLAGVKTLNTSLGFMNITSLKMIFALWNGQILYYPWILCSLFFMPCSLGIMTHSQVWSQVWAPGSEGLMQGQALFSEE